MKDVDDIPRIEIYRHHLKECLKDLLNRVDAIMDYCYTDDVSNIDVTISLNPDVEIPAVTYVTKTLCRSGYEIEIKPEKE